MKVLHLTVKKKWFDMIASGEKKEEYREIKEHWVVRLCKLQTPFLHDFASIRYDNLASAFAYCWGYKSGRANGIKFLFTKGGVFREYDTIVFKNGYGKNSPTIQLELKGFEISTAKPEWSDNWQGEVFVIKLGEILSPSISNSKTH